jgi:hypothetical protein
MSEFNRKTVLFVGSNPSSSSSEEVAFHGSARSSKVLMSWLKNINEVFFYVNVLNKPTENNRPLSSREIESNLERLEQDIVAVKPDKIVALGKTAAKALTLLGKKHYEMPHPSGRNRLLNDADFVKEKISGLENYISRPDTEISSSGSHEASCLESSDDRV